MFCATVHKLLGRLETEGPTMGLSVRSDCVFGTDSTVSQSTAASSQTMVHLPSEPYTVATQLSLHGVRFVQVRKQVTCAAVQRQSRNWMVVAGCFNQH
jgi:hypothetical protein